MPDPQTPATPDIQSTIKDPKFLALGPDDQVAVLKYLRESGGTPKPATPKSTIPPPPQPESPSAMPMHSRLPDADTLTKLGRGATLGAASGVGIPEAPTAGGVVSGALGNTASGIGTAAKEIAMDPLKGTFHVANNMVENIWASGREAWQGAKDSDPEQFAHGFASAATQILSLRGFFKDAASIAAEVPSKSQATARISAAIKPGGEEAAALERSMPDIIKTAKGSGITTVGELGEAVKKSKFATNEVFDKGLAPIRGRVVFPTQIAQDIESLASSDMLRDYRAIESAKKGITQSGAKNAKLKFSDSAWRNHDDVVEIQRQAKEYRKPWKVGELNDRRMSENENLTSYYNKDTRGQTGSPIRQAISKKIRDSAADAVYDEWDRANPNSPIKAQDLKAKQGSLWALDDYLNGKNGKIADLHAKQLEHEGLGPAGRFKVHAYASPSSSGLFRTHVSGLSEALSRGPEKVASKRVGSAFEDSTKRKVTRGAVASLPIDNLLRTPEQQRKTSFAIQPPPEPPQ